MWLFPRATIIIILTDTLAEKREKKQEQLLIFLSLRLRKHERGGASRREGGDRSHKDACPHLALAALLGMAFIVQWCYKSGWVISETEVDGAGCKCIQVIWVMETELVPQSEGSGGYWATCSWFIPKAQEKGVAAL